MDVNDEALKKELAAMKAEGLLDEEEEEEIISGKVRGCCAVLYVRACVRRLVGLVALAGPTYRLRSQSQVKLSAAIVALWGFRVPVALVSEGRRLR